MQYVDLSALDDYYGIDIIRPVIEKNASKFGGSHRHFAVADLTRDALPTAEAILCRDALVHVSYQDAAKILANFAATGAKWLLLNTYPEVTCNRNQFSGKRWRRLNLRLKPFQFPEPVEVIPDGGNVDPSQLAVWRLEDLPPLHPGAFRVSPGALPRTREKGQTGHGRISP
jgi:hypothetical protein